MKPLLALLIGIVGFVESVSVGQTLAARRRQRIEPNQELIALGAGNAAAALTGGFPVTGGFARSVVNFDAGAHTPAAGIFTAAGLALASLFLTPALYYLPQATLAATIIVAVLSLVDFSMLRHAWSYSRPDFIAAATLVGTLAVSVETGLVIGVGISLALYLYRTSRPHIAEVGWVPGTGHFRNVLRHRVAISPFLLSLHVDGSLYFANARYLEDRINDAVASHPALRHVVVLCSAINEIDASALESLEAIEERLLRAAGIALHLSEVKGPVMDRLLRTDFFHRLSGKVYLTHFQAVTALAPELFAAPPWRQGTDDNGAASLPFEQAQGQ